MSVTAITNAMILPMGANDEILREAGIVFSDTGIHEVAPMSSLVVPDGAKVVDGQDRLAVLPGLIDCHSHSSLLKGYTENAQLMDWLPEYQREHQVLTEDDAYWACMISYLEALKGGTTCVMDMYRFMHRGAQAAEQLGMRVHLVPYAADHESKHFFETLESNCALVEQCHGAAEGKVSVWFGLEHITYCSENMYREAARFAEHYGVRVHTHSSEQQEEVAAVEALFGRRPVQQFAEYGILNPGTVIAHGVWFDASEIALLSQSGSGVAHCPVSNAKLACGGPAPLAEYRKASVPVGLGTDGSISNNSLSMFETMKFGSLVQKNLHLDAAAVSAWEALRLATSDAAKLLGMADRLGSLEVGKQADLITVDLWQPHLQPLQAEDEHDPVPWNLVFAARASDVSHVWIDGVQVVANGISTRVDEHDVLRAAAAQTQSLINRRRGTSSVAMLGG